MRGNRRYVMSSIRRKTEKGNNDLLSTHTIPHQRTARISSSTGAEVDDEAFLRSLISAPDTSFLDELVRRSETPGEDVHSACSGERHRRRIPSSCQYVLFGMLLMYVCLAVWERIRLQPFWDWYQNQLQTSYQIVHPPNMEHSSSVRSNDPSAKFGEQGPFSFSSDALPNSMMMTQEPQLFGGKSIANINQQSNAGGGATNHNDQGLRNNMNTAQMTNQQNLWNGGNAVASQEDPNKRGFTTFGGT